MTRWCSLFLPCGADDPAAAATSAAALQSAAAALGYQPYDPFGLLPGKAYAQAVRLFVQPARGGWIRVIGEPDPALLPALSQQTPVLWAELDGAAARLEAYAAGSPVALEAAFPDQADCLRRAQQLGGATPPAASSREALGAIALDALPGDVQTLAQKVDLKQANALFARLSGNLAAKSGGAGGSGSDAAAGDLLRQPDWNSAGGAQIAAVLACLGLTDWQAPDFVTLRDAYALHVRRRRSPKAALYPGDAEALAAVPDALAYTPVYMGKN